MRPNTEMLLKYKKTSRWKKCQLFLPYKYISITYYCDKNYMLTKVYDLKLRN